MKKKWRSVSAVKKCRGFFWPGFVSLVTNNITGERLELEKMVGESFDGASNMRGQYIGVQKFIKDVAPNTLSEWSESGWLMYLILNPGLRKVSLESIF